ncbi:YdeI/OmpD-associated family protein [Flavihumibacter sp. RY-1]|uniref:YdeI/OmpD-associated family protein n=1 Tax=Flavihumibacter fluminis TaxID=2909236 RepID=A0ABS9BJ97_9BACT|nr:YdeI/OmpD-associated family protein [Flavihumibacter fluminis]MCF1715279.1 YdeI/OmpD-associated family protein [Flavihumibacter fluminis]
MQKIYKIQKFEGASMHYIELGEQDVKRLSKAGNKRVLCILNGKLRIHAAIQKTRDGLHYLMIGSKHLKTLGIKANASVKASITIDTTEFQFDLPEELTEVLATDDAANQIFTGLTDGNKRGLMALVQMVKSSDKKIERSLLIAEKLKLGITSPQEIMKK